MAGTSERHIIGITYNILFLIANCDIDNNFIHLFETLSSKNNFFEPQQYV